jgi:hypothetical protein
MVLFGSATKSMLVVHFLMVFVVVAVIHLNLLMFHFVGPLVKIKNAAPHSYRPATRIAFSSMQSHQSKRKGETR